MISPSAETLLNAIEQIELRSLVWGDVDASLSDRDVLRVAAATIAGDDVEDAVEDLIDRRLLYEFRAHGEGQVRRLRSRFAELVRLLVRLRQIFEGEDWRGAPRLVSDFRVDIRPRRFPIRNIESAILRGELASIGHLSALQQEVWSALTLTIPDAKPVMLAGFQARSVARLVEPPADSGTIVTAGTGSGKTIAFYLPAIVHIVPKIRANEFWTKALAVYPRRELLKDQLTEALSNARRIDATLTRDSRRPLIVGAFYGDMPNSASAADDELNSKGWRIRRDSVVCPIARCPDCGGDLAWPASDRARQRERLVCDNRNCRFETSADTFPLTRQSVQRRPPDILFTTTETLNRRMSDGWSRRLFGLGQSPNRRPNLMLLDEAHTYTGTSGAQVALLLRRWRRLLGAPVAFVGLSATLDEASRFFQELCGMAPERVVEICPDASEMTHAAAEYQVALRGDPVSQTALLSTSIQSVMLLGRMLDPRGRSVSEGRIGQRLFLFTDDLDVTHRLYDDLHDAEAYTRFRRPDGERTPLAALRAAGKADDAERNADGQLWRLPEQIGHNLSDRLEIGRTTSRDPGVAASADVIVATASLEVGFNDPLVGAVLQHKAPRNPAAFVQRRGRAGRSRDMRPITVTVLSDYGRDRRAFQAYEYLFDPRIPPQSLPIKNQYVLRIQATFALIDWLLEQCPEDERSAWLFPILSMPRTESRPESESSRAVRRNVQRVLTRLVRGEADAIGQLHKFLVEALDLEDEEVSALLWQPPRSLLLEAVPTLARRLFQNWHKAFPDETGELDVHVEWHPLPEYLPESLFSDLNLPDVRIIIPASSSWTEEKTETLPIGAALGQLAPGRVTRRFADEYGDLAHWVAVDPNADVLNMRVDNYARGSEYVGHFESSVAEPGHAIAVFRPHEIALTRVTKNQALPTSQGRFLWESAFECRGDSLDLDLPHRATWSERVTGVSFWLHRRQSSVSVRRFAPRAVAVIRRRGLDEAIVDIRLVDVRGDLAAVGFELDVDGLSLDLALPDPTALAARPLSPSLSAVSRTAFYRDLVESDPALPREVNVFQRDWLQQIFLSAVVLRAERDSCALSEAVVRLRKEGAVEAYSEVMEAIFAIQEAQVAATDDDEIEVDEKGQAEDGGRHPRHRLGRLKRRLRELFDNASVLDRLGDNLEAALRRNDDAWGRWLRDTLAESLAQAFIEAAINAAPQQSALDALVVDRFKTADGVRLWLTETALGGAGVIEALAERFVSQPGRFFQALQSALSPGDLELAASGLARTVELAVSDPILVDRLAEAREAIGHEERGAARERLVAALARRGVPAGHALTVALATRLLRPGTSRETDQLLFDLLERWDALEARCGLAIGLREYAYIAAILQPDISERLRQLTLIGPAEPVSRLVQVLAGFLWPRGPEVRRRALQSYNPYRQARYADATLARVLLFETPSPIVRVETGAWLEALRAALSLEGSACLTAALGNEATLRAAILEVVATPIEVGPLHLFPAVECAEQDGEAHCVTFALRELTG